MQDKAKTTVILRAADLATHKATEFSLSPEKTQLDTITDQLGLIALRKLLFKGSVEAQGKSGWLLKGQLGATAVQPCVVTLAPVTTRIDQAVTRRFTDQMQELDTAEEMEMPEDDSLEYLGDEINLITVMTEALALALPDYPRAEGAEIDAMTFTAPGVTPLTDEDTKPFSGLAGLKEKLEKGE